MREITLIFFLEREEERWGGGGEVAEARMGLLMRFIFQRS